MSQRDDSSTDVSVETHTRTIFHEMPGISTKLPQTGDNDLKNKQNASINFNNKRRHVPSTPTLAAGSGFTPRQTILGQTIADDVGTPTQKPYIEEEYVCNISAIYL